MEERFDDSACREDVMNQLLSSDQQQHHHQRQQQLIVKLPKKRKAELLLSWSHYQTWKSVFVHLVRLLLCYLIKGIYIIFVPCYSFFMRACRFWLRLDALKIYCTSSLECS